MCNMSLIARDSRRHIGFWLIEGVGNATSAERFVVSDGRGANRLRRRGRVVRPRASTSRAARARQASAGRGCSRQFALRHRARSAR